MPEKYHGTKGTGYFSDTKYENDDLGAENHIFPCPSEKNPLIYIFPFISKDIF